MNSGIKDNQVKKIASANGITLFWIQTQKFKTNSINIFFHEFSLIL